MRVFVAGATGAIGQQLVPKLVEAGHEVTGMTRSPEKKALVESHGAAAVVADALVAEQVAQAVATARPEVIVHQLTSIGEMNFKRLDEGFTLTNRLRTAGTDHLLSAGQAAGVKRFVAQSFFAAYTRTGSRVKDEEAEFGVTAPREMRQTVAALKYLEDAVLGATWTEGIALRYAGFYGPGTSMAPGEAMPEAIRAGKFPVVGSGEGMWSFIHTADAADATLAAIEHGRRGVYNVADDEPAPVRVWLPEYAAMLGGRRPRRVPRWLGRLVAGETGVMMMTELRGISNAKAKRDLGWQPAHPSWRQGLRG